MSSVDDDAAESTSTDTGDGTDTTGEEGDAANEIVDVELIKHPHQPMVVDLVVELADPGTLELEHLDDPGVVITRRDGNEPSAEQTFRVRGLAPGTEHVVDIGLGDEDQRAFDFVTDDPLPGFLPTFAIETTNTPPEDAYRLFDVGRFPADAIAGLFMVDTTGTTRWYTGAPNTMAGPGGVWSGVRILDDGSLMFLRNDAMLILGELDAVEDPQMTVSASDLEVDILHHDVIPLPNGNYVTLSATVRDVDYPGEGLLPTVGDLIVEFDSTGQKVWIWDAFDHLDPQRIRGGFEPDGNPPGHDWTHANGIEYWADLDLVILCMRHQDWVVAVDHESGEVEWRLGDEGDFSLDVGEWFFHPHSPQRQADGSLLLYDNGVENPYVADPDERSRAVQYALDLDLLTATQIWEDDEQDLMSRVMGDADRMPGGNVLVLDSAIDLPLGPEKVHARLRELDPEADPQRVWAMHTPPSYFAYRAVPTTRLVGMAK